MIRDHLGDTWQPKVVIATGYEPFVNIAWVSFNIYQAMQLLTAIQFYIAQCVVSITALSYLHSCREYLDWSIPHLGQAETQNTVS